MFVLRKDPATIRKPRFGVILICTALFALALPPVQTYAYSFNGHVMQSQIWYQASAIFYSATRETMRQQMVTWNNLIPEYRRVCYNPITHSRNVCPFQDGNSSIYKEPDSDPSNLARNYYFCRQFNGSKVLIESDININSNKNWVNGAVSGRYDVGTVMLHELGHTVGLGHSGYKAAAMYPTQSTGVVKQSLHFDDKNGYYARYN